MNVVWRIFVGVETRIYTAEYLRVALLKSPELVVGTWVEYILLMISVFGNGRFQDEGGMNNGLYEK